MTLGAMYELVAIFVVDIEPAHGNRLSTQMRPENFPGLVADGFDFTRPLLDRAIQDVLRHGDDCIREHVTGEP